MMKMMFGRLSKYYGTDHHTDDRPRVSDTDLDFSTSDGTIPRSNPNDYNSGDWGSYLNLKGLSAR